MMVLYIIAGLLLACVVVYAVIIALFIVGWGRIPVFKVDPDYQPRTKISVVVPTRNHMIQVYDCITALVAQNYPQDLFEIIIIDDHSEDNTAWKVNEHWGDNPLVKYVPLESGEGKKRAIAKGIEIANGELIAATDADCFIGVDWLATIARYYEKHKPKMIVMPVLFHLNDSDLGPSMQALEFMSLIGISGATIGLKKPMLCNGANLAYTKEAYQEVHGFEGNDTIASGDDVFLLHKIAAQDSNAVHYLKNENVVVKTPPELTWKAFFNQRFRWASKTPLYQDNWTLFVSCLVFSTNLLFLIGLAFSLFHLKMGIAVWLSFSVKCIIDIIFLFLVASTFRSERLLWYFLPVQLLYPIYVVVVAVGSVTTKTTWKGRNIN